MEETPTKSKIIDPNANRPRLIESVNEVPPPTLEDIVTEAMHSVAALGRPRFFNMTVDSPIGDPIPVTLVVMLTPKVQMTPAEPKAFGGNEANVVPERPIPADQSGAV